MLRICLSIAMALLIASPAPAIGQDRAATVRIEIASRTPAFGGASFGERGPYEQIAAVAHMRIDPEAPGNEAIVDLALAPRDAAGMVRYDVDLMILRPRDAAKARGVMLFDVVNRGMRTAGQLNGGSIGPGEAMPRGDDLLMRGGYTIVASGWQGDLKGPGLIAARFPVATDQGRPIVGRIATEMVFDSPSGDRIALPYPAATRDRVRARLTVAARTGDAPMPVPGWRFIDERQVAIERPPGIDAGAIYRFEYVARDPILMGLGFAAVRDLVSFLRHAPASAGNPLADLAAAPCKRDSRGACANPAGGAFAATIAYGVSQSGRYLRDFVWQGFNRDLAGRPVFDGVMTMVPGARQTFTNFRFAEPGRFSRQHEDHDVPGFTFPFAYATLADPVTGRSDGILKACAATGTCPKLIHYDTGAEFWQAAASLVGTGGTGRDVPFPANVRAYLLASGSHAPGRTAPFCKYPANPMPNTAVQRALLVAMTDWTLGRREPPASRWPSLSRGELVVVEALEAPRAPSLDLAWPRVLNEPVPPPGRPQWPTHVPTVDPDGNELPGIRLPPTAAPTGTYLSWNMRKAGYAEGDLCSVMGGYLPFAADARSRGDDPRRSLAERYPKPGTRAALAERAAQALVRERLLLPEDVPALLKEEQAP